jgi:FkbM family methyltransferase
MDAQNKYIPEGGVVFDVVGFRGVTSQWFSRSARQVFTFEPMPENADSIRTVLKVRGIKNISLHDAALSENIGTRDFHIFENKGHNSLGRVNTSQHIKTIQVPTTTLDEFTSKNQIDRIDFLKIDVEGFELEVLEGASRLLASKKIRAILFEANRPVLKSIGKTAAPIYDLLRSYAYSVTDLDGRSVSVSEVDQCEFGDFLARPS